MENSIYPGQWFYKFCDAAADAATYVLPEAVRDRGLALYFTMGMGGGYGAMYAVDNFLQRRFPNYSPKLVTIGTVVGAIIAPVTWAALDPADALAQMQEHSFYTIGEIGGSVGAIARALQVQRNNEIARLETEHETRVGELEDRIRTLESAE